MDFWKDFHFDSAEHKPDKWAPADNPDVADSVHHLSDNPDRRAEAWQDTLDGMRYADLPPQELDGVERQLEDFRRSLGHGALTDYYFF